jgi:hypothetical protein
VQGRLGYASRLDQIRSKQKSIELRNGVRVRVAQQVSVTIEGLAPARVPHGLGDAFDVGSGGDEVAGETMPCLVGRHVPEAALCPGFA